MLQNLPKIFLKSFVSWVNYETNKKLKWFYHKKNDKISSVAPKIISSNSIATVVDDSGKICGELTKDQIIDILFIDKENNA